MTTATNEKAILAPANNNTFAMTVLTSLFFMWGFITCLNDILIPHLKKLFTLNYTEAMLIQFTFFGAYFIMSLPAGILVDKIGYKRGIIIGLCTAGIGTLLFYPAAGNQSYPLFLGAFFILASGITLLQVAANPYVAILGKPETASSRLNLTQAFNSLGTFLAPFFGSFLILSVATAAVTEMDKAAEASRVQMPYLLLTAALFIIAAIIAVTKLPAIHGETLKTMKEGKTTNDSAWKYPHLVLGAVAIFVYVGAEVSIGSFLVNFLGTPDIAGFSAEKAGYFVSFYWGGAMVGRFIGSAVMRKIKPGHMLAFNSFAASFLVVLTMLTSGYMAMAAILLVGLFNSIMFPTIFTLGVDRLGKHTGQGSGILCMAIVGGAVVPLLQGFFADRIGIHHAFFLPAVCYLYIAYYGLKGHVIKKHIVS
jgi:MFS transporter, FHS family, L-fucose permease